MAFTSVGSLIADNSTTTNQASWTTSATLGNALNAGSLGVLIYAIDNLGNAASGNTDQVTSVVDSVGNHWLKADEYALGGSVGSTACVSIWWCIATTTLGTSGTITFNHARTSASIVSKAVSGWVYTFGSGKRVAPRSRVYATSTTSAPSMSLSSLPNVEHLFVRGIAREGNGTGFTGTTNYTPFTSSVANSGTGTTSMLCRGEWRILTGTGDTSAPTLTTGGDQANIFVDFVEYADTLLSPRVLDASGSGADQTSYITAATIAPAADTLVLAWVASRVASGTPSAPTISGAGLTWNLEASSVESGGHIGIFCFSALSGASPSSGQITFDWGATTQTQCVYSLEEYFGFGTYSIIQNQTGNITSATTLTLTLSALANANNATLGGFFCTNAAPGYGVVPANNANVGQFSHLDSSTYTLMSSWRYDGNTNVAFDASVGSTTSGVGIAIEVSAATADNIDLSGIGSAEAFGSATVNRNVTLSGIASAEAFGSATVNRNVTISGISSAEAFGTLSVADAINLSGIASAEAFGSATVNRNVILSGIASAEAFGTTTVNRNVTLSGIASAEAFGTTTINRNVTLSGIASAEAFGTTTVNGTVALSGITSAEAFGTLSVADAINLSGIASAEAFGSATVNCNVTLSGIASAEAFGTLSVADAISLSGIASAEAFGSTTVNRNVTLSGIASAEAFGSVSVSRPVTLSGIASAEAFGSATVNRTVTLSGIASAEAFGSATVNRNVTLSGIASAEAFGSATISGIAFLQLSGIPSAEAFGAVTVSRRISLSGIASAEAFGTLSLSRSEIVLSGIPSAEAFGVITFSSPNLFPPWQHATVALSTEEIKPCILITETISQKGDGTVMRIARGTSRDLVIPLTDSTGNVYDPTGKTVWVYVKRKTDDDTSPLIAKNSDDPTEVMLTLGEIRVKFYPLDTKNLPIGLYHYDAWIEISPTERYPLMDPEPFHIYRSVSEVLS